MKILFIALALPALVACNQGGDGTDDAGVAGTGTVGTGNAVGADALNACVLATPLMDEITQLINEARAQARTCGAYGDFAAAGNVSWNGQLSAAADSHSRDMAYYNFFSHTGSDGSDPGLRASSAGYSYRTLGENIAAGLIDTRATVQGWLNSPGHCANIMRADFTELGAACIEADTSDYPTYWTLVLAAPL
jgi:uncharacterized protein YkwD